MKNKKKKIVIKKNILANDGIRTRNLWNRSPTRYHCATPASILVAYLLTFDIFYIIISLFLFVFFLYFHFFYFCIFSLSIKHFSRNTKKCVR
jgi:hypothetical protein